MSRALPLVALVLLGCADEPGEASADALFSRTDSAGVSIVRHGDVAGRLPEWSATDTAVLRIGSVADPDQALSQVRGARRLPDGRVVVADGGSSSLRVYGIDGDLEGTIGGPGEGPGEFSMLFGLWPAPGDSLLAYDLRFRRVSVFDRDGALGRTFELAADDVRGRGVLGGVFADGSLLVRGFSNASGAEPTDGRQTSASALFRYTGDGTYLDSIPALVRSEAFFETFDGGFWVTVPPFAAQGRVAPGRDLVLADAGSGEIRVRGTDGALRLILRGPPGAPVDADADRTHREWLLRQAAEGADAERLRRHLPTMASPERMPAFGALALDDGHRIWVRDWAPAPTGREAWTVYAPDGEPVARVRLPQGLEPLHVGHDFVLGLVRDELDVEYLQLHALEGAGGG